MGGIEKPQIEQIAALAEHPSSFDPGPSLTHPIRATPNQRLMAATLALGRALLRGDSRTQAESQAMALLEAMELYGHQKTGAGSYSNEQGSPDPHSGLWAAGMAGMLWLSGALGAEDIQGKAVDYWGAHLALCRSFWTPLGCRMPCARAKPAPPRPLAPNWTVDSHCVALLLGESVAGLPRPTPDDFPIRLLRKSQHLFPAVVEASRKPLSLGVSIRKWALPEGGFLAAMSSDVPLNDPLAWLEVNAAGHIVSAHPDLSNFVPPATEPELIGTGVGSSSPAPTNPSLDAAQMLWGLTLSRLNKEWRLKAIFSLEKNNRAAALAAAANITVNPDQQSKLDQALVALAA